MYACRWVRLGVVGYGATDLHKNETRNTQMVVLGAWGVIHGRGNFPKIHDVMREARRDVDVCV